MSAAGMPSGCQTCARRGSLLARLSVPLDYRARNPERLWETLTLTDESLIAALGGRQRERLKAWHASLSGDEEPCPPNGVEKICRHRDLYPSKLRDDALAPHELQVTGGAHRLLETLDGPVVAIVGSRRCTDYGLEMARGLAHDLAAAGIPMLGELSAGIARSAQAGAIEAKGATIALLAGGLDRCPESCEPAYRQIHRHGCIASELPRGTPSRLWSELARTRTLVLLAELVIVVEAECSSRELACAQLVRTRGKKLAAVPGRVTSKASDGSNRLLREGAELVRSAEDALEVLYGVTPGPARAPHQPVHAGFSARWTMAPSHRRLPQGAGKATSGTGIHRLEPRLQEVLRMIGEGKDTILKLDTELMAGNALLVELAELELRGLVRRGDGGRYLPCAVARCG